MTLKKNFLQPDIKSYEISKSRIIIGIIIGIFYSILLYCFFYLIREVFRILSVIYYGDLWILTDNEVHFYNLIYAFIAVIFGQSMCFNFWINKPKGFYKRLKWGKTTIINDQNGLNWYFLSWFSKSAVVYGIIFSLTFNGAYYVFSLYPDYNYIFIFIIIVLFFQTWTKIISTFKRRSVKWLLTSIILVSIISFGLSRINVINYKAINTAFLKKNISYRYNLVLPESDVYKEPYENLLVKNIYFVEAKEKQINSNPIIVIDNQEVALKDLCQKIIDFQSSIDDYERSFIRYRLHIHRDIKMKSINELKKELSKAGVFGIDYAVLPTKLKYDIRYYQNLSFSYVILPYYSNSFLSFDLYKEVKKVQNLIKITYKEPDKYFVNDSLVEYNKLQITLETLILKNPDFIINYYINDNCDFSNYMNVLFYSKEIVNALRKDYAIKKYSEDYKMLDYKKSDEVRNKYPFRVFEMTNEIKDYLNAE